MHIVMFAADTPTTLCQDKHKDNDLHLPAELLNSCQSLLIKISILIVDLSTSPGLCYCFASLKFNGLPDVVSVSSLGLMLRVKTAAAGNYECICFYVYIYIGNQSFFIIYNIFP